jgi:PAS domain S-box-containing protein
VKRSETDGLFGASPIHTGFWSPRPVLLLTISIALLIGASVLALRSIASVAAASAWSVHTERARFQIVRVVQLLSDVETAERGFAATGNAEFLAPDRAAMPVLPRELAELGGLIADNPTQTAYSQRLTSAANARVVLAQAVIERAAGGDLEGARALIATGEGKRVMDTVREVAAGMQAEEDRLLELRSDGARRAERNARYAASLAGILAVFLVIFVAFASTRDARRVRRAQEDLSTTLRSVGDAVIATDVDGGIRFMNRVAEQLTGWREATARGLPLDRVFHIINEETRASVESPVIKVIREGAIAGLANHTILIARDGRELAIEDSGAPIWDRGKLAGVVLVFRDATARRLNERALIESEQRFRAAVVAVAGVLWTNTAEGEMRGEQPGWAALTGQEFADYQGFGWAKAVHPDDAQPTVDAWMDAVSKKRLFVFEHRVRRYDGQWRRFSIRAVPLIDGKGAIREWVGVHTDITEHRNGEPVLRQ